MILYSDGCIAGSADVGVVLEAIGMQLRDLVAYR